jgi:DNA-directed RNA polymerase subunit beta'
VAEEDCGTAAGLAVALPAVPDPDGDRRACARLRGRHLAADLADPATGACLARSGTELDDATLDRLLASPARPPSILARSPLRCAARRGVCRRCYGRDPATGETVALGAAVGVIAAQSIGEPGTQLTMKDVPARRVASAANITGGLPRVEELFEATRPRGVAILAPCDGLVAIEEGTNGPVMAVHPAGGACGTLQLPMPPGA